ncbi:hypothetical protein GM547_13765, partial [Streptococcus pneumoniae]|uniref:hypothetical protein n=1 Tax=Streptococcus pneumoniae TaxID=1313 RepID=UPI0012D70944
MTLTDRARAWMRGWTSPAPARPAFDTSTPWADLPLRRETATEQHVTTAAAFREDMLAAGGMTLDSDEASWRRITS